MHNRKTRNTVHATLLLSLALGQIWSKVLFAQAAQPAQPISTDDDFPVLAGAITGSRSLTISEPVYRSTSLPLPLMGAAILASTTAAALFLYNNVDNQWSPDFQVGGNQTGSNLLSTVGEGVAFSVPFAFLSAVEIMPRFDARRRRTVAVTYQLFETLGLTIATTYALKMTVGRERPNLSDDFSFPSAHSAETFAVATTLALNYPWYVGLPSLAGASIVALSRFDLNEHYLSDIVAGSGIGILFATTTHLLHRFFDEKSSRLGKARAAAGRQNLFLPLAANDSYGLEWRYSF